MTVTGGTPSGRANHTCTVDKLQRIGAPEQAVFRGWVVQRTASSLRDKARNALVVGLGGGSVAQYWRNTSLSVHAVEIDGRVAKLAETHFGVTRGTTLVEEGLRFQMQAKT